MTETVLLPGARDARGTLDTAPAEASEARSGTPGACVVACPPHPQHGGNSGDRRLRAVSDALVDRGVDCLRIDYGPWDRGRGERSDTTNAAAWARERYDRVGLFGYSFGGGVALSAAARDAAVDSVAALAPPARLGEDGDSDGDDGSRASADGVDVVDVAEELAAMSSGVRVGVFYGTRDDLADADPVVAAARERGHAVVGFDAGHRFAGRASEVADAVAEFLVGQDDASL